ncbi:MAG: hypothetical protein C5B50_21975, partial [Verrucomicrobia bacterium]
SDFGFRISDLLLALFLTLALSTHAGLYSSGNINAVIPDADPNGIALHMNVSGFGAGDAVQTVNVFFNISGGYNGDYYAYLSYNGILVPLLNRVGTSGSDPFGYGNPGFGPTTLGVQFELSDSGAFSIHNYQDHSPVYNSNGQLTGAWAPDGGTLSSFNGQQPNGTWTIFFSDQSGGDQGTLVNWSLEIDSIIPEPVSIALPVFGLIIGLAVLSRWLRTPAR